jgi:hypothetical protein
MTHTQGPWVAVGDYVEAHDLDEPLSVCTLADCGDATQVNARLIAAAPDLLAALIELDAWVINESGAAYPEGTFEFVRATIRKAKGELA